MGEKLRLYSDKEETVIGLREILTKEPEATLAEISYEEKGGKGTRRE